MGEIGMLAGQRTSLAGVVTEPGVVIRVPTAHVVAILSHIFRQRRWNSSGAPVEVKTLAQDAWGTRSP